MTRNRDERPTRRSLIQSGWRSAAAVGLGGLLPPVLKAFSSPLDRAVVSIQFFGGNDSNNLVVPLEAAAYESYAVARGGLALPASTLLPVSASGDRLFGFHPSLPEVQQLYQSGVLSVVANVGVLPVPLTQAQLRASPLPPELFQHQNADQVTYVANGFAIPSWIAQAQRPGPPFIERQVFTFESGLSLTSPETVDVPGSLHENPVLKEAMQSARIETVFPSSSLGRELAQAARLLCAAPKLGFARPAIFCPMSGFDTHSNQLPTQARLFRELSLALAAFYAATMELGVHSRVTTFTQTEFNRALVPNGTGGTEHGWGGHQLVMGGAVTGGDVRGTFPSLTPGGPDDAGLTGVWIPTTSNAQYSATLATWFGVSPWNMGIPNLQNFATRNLGFLA